MIGALQRDARRLSQSSANLAVLTTFSRPPRCPQAGRSRMDFPRFRDRFRLPCKGLRTAPYHLVDTQADH